MAAAGIRSFAAQTPLVPEIVVVDNGSVDDRWSVLAGSPPALRCR
jgi:hypothetical protein